MDHSHRRACLGQTIGRFKSEQPATDDGRTGAWPHTTAHQFDIGAITERQHARKIAPRKRKPEGA